MSILKHFFFIENKLVLNIGDYSTIIIGQNNTNFVRNGVGKRIEGQMNKNFWVNPCGPGPQ